MYKLEFWQNLLLICEIISNGYFLVSLDFLLIFVVFCGIIVTINKNPALLLERFGNGKSRGGDFYFIAGKTIKLREHLKTYDTKLYMKLY